MRSQEGEGGRNAQVVRLLRIVRDLDRLGGVDVYELAERNGVTTRTIRRDLEALVEAGLPIAEDALGRRKRRRAVYKDPLRKVGALLDAGHYLALRLAMEDAAVARRTSSIFAQLEDLSGRVEAALGSADRQRLAAIEACFHSREAFAWRRAPPDVLWPIVEAARDRRVCRVRYRAPRAQERETEFDILPLRIVAHDGAAYLLGWVEKYGTITTLNLQRLHGLRVTEVRADPPAGFSPEAWEDAVFGMWSTGPETAWRLRFTADAAPYVRERSWHPTQALEERPDGGVDLTLTCRGGVEVLAWIASWREQVEVIEPAEARAELRRLGAWLTDTYRDG